jgi:hypothetical protein
MFANPFAPENLVSDVDDNDGDVRAITVTIQHRGHPEYQVGMIVPQITAIGQPEFLPITHDP